MSSKQRANLFRQIQKEFSKIDPDNPQFDNAQIQAETVNQIFNYEECHLSHITEFQVTLKNLKKIVKIEKLINELDFVYG